MHSWLSCTLFLSCTLLLSCTLYCHALFSQNGGFCSEKTSNPPLLVTKKSLFWTKSSTLGYENLKNLHFGSFFFFIRFFVKTWKTSTFGGFLLKSEDFVQNRLPILHFWCFFFSKILHFWLRKLSFLIPQSATRCKNTSKSLPSLFFWWSPPVLQVSSRLEHFKFFLSQGSPLWIIFPNFDKMQKSCIFCFSRYGPHFLTQYSGLPQEQF